MNWVQDRMQVRPKVRMMLAALGMAALGYSVGVPYRTLAAQAAAPGSGTVMLSSGQVSGQVSGTATETGQVVREIDDPHLGTRWLLVRDPQHPGGPGRLTMVPLVSNRTQRRRAGGAATEFVRELRLPVIRAGDRLIVEAITPVVEARLEAVALSPAEVGSMLEARLKIGGRVVPAVALGPGRAALQLESGVRP